MGTAKIRNPKGSKARAQKVGRRKQPKGGNMAHGGAAANKKVIAQATMFAKQVSLGMLQILEGPDGQEIRDECFEAAKILRKNGMPASEIEEVLRTLFLKTLSIKEIALERTKGKLPAEFREFAVQQIVKAAEKGFNEIIDELMEKIK